ASDVPLAESNDERAEEIIDDGGDACPGFHAWSFSDSVCSYSASARLSPGARSRIWLRGYWRMLACPTSNYLGADAHVRWPFVPFALVTCAAVCVEDGPVVAVLCAIAGVALGSGQTPASVTIGAPCGSAACSPGANPSSRSSSSLPR